MRIGHKEFEAAVERAIGMIPVLLREQLHNLAIVVEERPSRSLLQELEVPPGETLFGLFTGVPLPDRSAVDPPLYPDVILIFREPLLTACDNLEELEDEIAITVVHEVAHFMGLSEERLEELGYG